MRSLKLLGDSKLKWYRNLYLGDNARKAKYKTFGLIRKNRFTIDTYIIAISDNPDNILDIYSANVLKQPHFKNKSYRNKVYVVGLAKGRNEALELVRCIVDDTYSHTGDVDVAGYLKFGTKLRKDN